MMNRSWLYILECCDGSYYVGSTVHLEQRMSEHHEGKYPGYTSVRLPVKLLWHCEFSDIREAFAYERRVKKWSRAKKEALMQGDFELLHQLSKSSAMKKKIEQKKVIQRRNIV